VGSNHRRTAKSGSARAMNIVMPMAGRGARLADWQQNTPKPLIQVAGKPMILWAMESLQGLAATHLTLIALAEHERLYSQQNLLHILWPIPCEFVWLDQVTEGQLCTVLAARKWIDTDEDLLIASADTLVRSHLAEDIRQKSSICRGIISVADLPGERWSFARTDEYGNVVEVAEKVRISDYASTGLYYFQNGHDFVAVADEIIQKQEKTRGEYYVIPVYQKYIERGWTVNISQASETWDMGNPEAIMEFERNYTGPK
jgi:UDP-N-acetylglucosamine diphosphorylase / glucose-1-phosphate thymidylyltransferase / UDP-N-acetylgalactosamine diphosphorylase / glucosamine-1-phosphate N-acetyltransferase / galactosamine-1-phosphate N-acetyltransferase